MDASNRLGGGIKMRRAVKRLFCIFLSALLVCQLCSGCTSNEPERTVKQFCKAMQSMDFETMTPLLSDANSELAESLNNLLDALSEKYQIVELFQLCAKNIRFKITSRSARMGSATEVSVKFSYPDLYAILKDYLNENKLSLDEVILQTLADAINYLSDLIAGTTTDTKVSQLTTTPRLIDWTITKLRKRQYPTVSVTITFQCMRLDNNLWRISSAESLLQILTFGFLL